MISQQSSYLLRGVVERIIFHQEVLRLNSLEDNLEACIRGLNNIYRLLQIYLSLGEAGYIHEAVNHSSGEWVRGECHINGCENRASLLSFG
jgi:hypothetical protein